MVVARNEVGHRGIAVRDDDAVVAGNDVGTHVERHLQIAGGGVADQRVVDKRKCKP